jgi:hypothetical protein
MKLITHVSYAYRYVISKIVSENFSFTIVCSNTCSWLMAADRMFKFHSLYWNEATVVLSRISPDRDTNVSGRKFSHKM